MSEFNLTDLIDLPLKRRVNGEGYYSPSSVEPEFNQEARSPRPPQSKETPLLLIPSEPLKEGEQYRFHFDMTRCIGCQCCVVA